MARNKMLRKRKQFGRCHVQGHGQNLYCEVCQEIQEQAFTRSQEKREWEKEILEEINTYKPST